MNNSPASNLKTMIYSSLFTALTIVGAYISIPIGIIPIVLSSFFIYLGGLLLGKKWSFISNALYLFLGLIGLPVFSGGNGGFHHIYGPTGGYLVGFLLASFIIGLISENKNSILYDSLSLVAGTIIIYLCGILWLMFQFPSGWQKTSAVLWIFIAGDIIKMVAAIALAKVLRPMFFTTSNAMEE